MDKNIMGIALEGRGEKIQKNSDKFHRALDQTVWGVTLGLSITSKKPHVFYQNMANARSPIVFMKNPPWKFHLNLINIVNK